MGSTVAAALPRCWRGSTWKNHWRQPGRFWGSGKRFSVRHKEKQLDASCCTWWLWSTKTPFSKEKIAKGITDPRHWVLWLQQKLKKQLVANLTPPTCCTWWLWSTKTPLLASTLANGLRPAWMLMNRLLKSFISTLEILRRYFETQSEECQTIVVQISLSGGMSARVRKQITFL